jgi:hypothetical protein
VRAKTKIGIGIADGVLVLAGGAAAVATVAGDRDDISGPVDDQARAAAAAVPRGTAAKVEPDADAGTAYTETVAKPDGSEVVAELDKNHHVLGLTPEGHDGDDQALLTPACTGRSIGGQTCRALAQR